MPSGRLLSNCYVMSPRAGGKTVTDDNGQFTFLDLSIDQNYIIRLSRPGYRTCFDYPYRIVPGYDATFGPITLRRCRIGNCGDRLRPNRQPPDCK
jgi:hypothetical protein